jgi:L-rhamnose mutarotase
MSKRYCFALDLKNDPELIAQYKDHHQNVWPEVTQSFRDAGIENLEIYLLGTRLVMIIEANERFSVESKTTSDLTNAKVREWETLMWKFQQSLPQARPGEKWLPMERIYRYQRRKGQNRFDRT